MSEPILLGIDVGGTAIKGALIDVQKGELLTERLRLPTPQPAKPDAMAKVVKKIVKTFKWEGKPIGCGFPAIVKNGVAHSAANIDPSWIGTSIEEVFGKSTGCPVFAINDADAAGLGSIHFGSGKDVPGTVLLITIGSGLGSGLFCDGQLVPNTELGHLYLGGRIAEHYASAKARDEAGISWRDWGKRFNKYLRHIERVFSPDLILLGGGGSNKFDEFADRLKVKAPVMPEELYNRAGLIGAAYYAHLRLAKKTISNDHP
jgi:polyphosphate glucokinase